MSSSKLRALAVALLAAGVPAQIQDDVDLDSVRRAVEGGEAELPAVEARWRQTLERAATADDSFRELFGYDPPGSAVQLAFLRAFLFGEQGRADDAQRAAALLLRVAGYRDAVPAELRGRAEYAGGLPAVPNFFLLADYARAWRGVRGAPGVDDATRRVIDEALAGSAEFVFVFPEWGAHNRAMLRAEGLLEAARALPDDARAGRWRKLAAILAADSLDAWEIEDAQLYQPIWLLALLRYAEAAGDEHVCERLQVRYYLRYFAELLSPAGTIPDFGDAWWNGGLARCYECLARGAAALRDPELEWAARRVYAAMPPFDRAAPDVGRALLFAQLAPVLRDGLEPREPAARSGPVLDDVIGKKLVFRTGRGDDDAYLLLNYRDEGDWGRLARDHLRDTLAVVEEKMHHGHADENAIVLLMDRGSVLLHDAGYREVAPSGPFGAYRADVFHNRLVVRRGVPAPGQGTFEFLRDAGAYRRTRTEQIDFVAFETCEYGRTRVTEDALGYEADRTIVFVGEPRLFVVFDSVRFLRDGDYTLSTLWAVRDVVSAGDGFAVGRTDRIEERRLPGKRDLLLAFPGRATATPDRFPLRRHRQDETVVHETRSAHFAAGEHAVLVTVLWPIEPGADAAALAARLHPLAASPDGVAAGLTIENGDEGITIGIKADLGFGRGDADRRPRYQPDAGRVRYDDVTTDADFVFVRRRGDEARWCATNMTHVRIGGREAFASRPLQVFQTSGRSDVVGRAKWRRWEDRVRLR